MDVEVCAEVGMIVSCVFQKKDAQAKNPRSPSLHDNEGDETLSTFPILQQVIKWVLQSYVPPTLIAMHPVLIHLEITNAARAKGLHMVSSE